VDAIFDTDDAMKVQTRSEPNFRYRQGFSELRCDRYRFFCLPLNIFNHLERVKRDGDCSLADGVRSMASEGKARAVDIGMPGGRTSTAGNAGPSGKAFTGTRPTD